MKRQLAREILLLIAAAVLLGFVYSFVVKLGFFSDKSPDPTMSNPDLEMITLARAKELFESDSALFIDSRHEFEYRNGHIRGAINISLKEFDVHRNRLDDNLKNKLLVVYCDGAQCNSSIEVAVKLMEIGFKNILIFFGGWQEWSSANLPTAK